MLDESNISIINNLVFQIYPSGKITGIKRLKVLGVTLQRFTGLNLQHFYNIAEFYIFPNCTGKVLELSFSKCF